MMHIDVNL